MLPWMLAGAVKLGDTYLRRRRHPEKEPARFWPLLLLSYLSVASHTLLDWMNTYGVRVLMPFDGQWFYGDALFIIDPWMWLLAGAAVVMADARARWSIGGWLLLGAATTGLILFTDLTPLPLKALWLVGVAAVAFLRIRGIRSLSIERVATVCGITLLLYMVAMFAGSRLAERQVAEWLRQQGTEPERVMANPLPANPFTRDVMALLPGRYEFIELDWLGGSVRALPPQRPEPPARGSQPCGPGRARRSGAEGLRELAALPHLQGGGAGRRLPRGRPGRAVLPPAPERDWHGGGGAGPAASPALSRAYTPHLSFSPERTVIESEAAVPAATTEERWSWPPLFGLLEVPFGAAVGFLQTAVPYWLAKDGMPLADIGLLSGTAFSPHAWKLLVGAADRPGALAARLVRRLHAAHRACCCWPARSSPSPHSTWGSTRCCSPPCRPPRPRRTPRSTG